jgi:hypothetical protein
MRDSHSSQGSPVSGAPLADQAPFFQWIESNFGKFTHDAASALHIQQRNGDPQRQEGPGMRQG